MLFSRLRPEPRMNIHWQPGRHPSPRYERQLYEALWRYDADAQGVVAAQVMLSRLDPEDGAIEAALVLLGPGDFAGLKPLDLDAAQTELVLGCAGEVWALAPYLAGRLICANPRFAQDGLHVEISLRARFIRKVGPAEFLSIPGRTLSLVFDTDWGRARCHLGLTGGEVSILHHESPHAMPALVWQEILSENPVARQVRDLLRSETTSSRRQLP